jgi:hypothetical protein
VPKQHLSRNCQCPPLARRAQPAATAHGNANRVARTVPRGRFQRRVRERILRAVVQRETGLQVALSCEGRQRRVYVHRLAPKRSAAW